MMAVFLLPILVTSGIYFNYLSPNHDIMVDKRLNNTFLFDFTN